MLGLLALAACSHRATVLPSAAAFRAVRVQPQLCAGPGVCLTVRLVNEGDTAGSGRCWLRGGNGPTSHVVDQDKPFTVPETPAHEAVEVAVVWTEEPQLHYAVSNCIPGAGGD